MRLIALCTAALAGIALGDLAHPAALPLVGAAGLCSVAAVCAWRSAAWCTLGLAACAAALGAWRAASVPAPYVDGAAALAPYLNTQVRLRASLRTPPTPTASGLVRTVVDVLAVGPVDRDAPAGPPEPQGGIAPAIVIGEAGALVGLADGDHVTLEGRLLPAADARGPPSLLFPRVLAAETDPSPRGRAERLLGGLRQQAQVSIGRYLPEPQASLAAGVLLGGSGRLDAAFRVDLQRSGLAHVVAIDGFKQVVVAATVGAVGRHLAGARVGSLTSVLAIAGYTLLTGAHPSAVRAGLMVSLACLASLSGRVADPLTSLLLAATLMAAIEPRILLDVGLQLSLSATLGILLLWPRLRRRLRRARRVRRLPRFVVEPVGLTLAVTLASLPVTLSAFQQVSLVSPVAHIIAVPLLHAVLVTAALLALAAPFSPLGGIVAWLAWLPSTLLVWCVHAFGSLPGAALSNGRLPVAGAACLGATLLLWGVWQLPELRGVRLDIRGWRTRHVGLVAASSLSVACLCAAVLLRTLRADGRLHLERLAVGQGEAYFARGPGGRSALVVIGRADAVALEAQVADHLAIWEHKLDTVVVADANAHKAVTAVLQRYPAEQLIKNASGTRVELGAGTELNLGEVNGRLVVSTLAPTTFAARPGSED